ncbi:MAG: hypothetical protein Q9P01_04540 [Anaerolineae bacterium]|nr:hypothetical protein [Anaerolineae bacterium]MDQ7034109.1 hypothetical protein [Anaerolineae bacterium]
MPDGVYDNSQTGNFPKAELEPRLKAECNRRKMKPEIAEDAASKTGMMPIYREPVDESAVGDEDQPAE